MKHLLRLLLLVVFAFSASCANMTSRSKTANSLIKKISTQKVFYYPYESVWRASQLSLKYPLAVNNMDTGNLETEYIKGLDGWLEPEAKKDPSPGIRYKISLNLVKGTINGKEVVRMTMNKKLELKRDFFSEPENIQSNGLEELTIFYRIERELIIEDALKKVASQN